MRSTKSFVLLVFIRISSSIITLHCCEGWKQRLFARNARDNSNNNNNDLHAAYSPLEDGQSAGGTAVPPPPPSPPPPFPDHIAQAHQLFRALKNVIFFKPPVGVVSLYCIARLILTGRIFHLLPNEDDKISSNSKASAEQVLKHSEARGGRHRRKKRPKRALALDPGDRSYALHGGIAHARRKLCCAVIEESRRKDPDDQFLKHLLSAIRVTYDPGVSAVDFAREIADELVMLDKLEAQPKLGKAPYNDDIIEMARVVAELRAIDAMVRTTRSRLVVTCSKLKRIRRYWRRRVRMATKLGRVAQLVGLNYLEDDRERLSLAEGMYHDEVERLGKTQSVLRAKPGDLGEESIVSALSLSRNDKSVTKSISWLSRLTIRFNDEGRGRVHLKWFDQSTFISSDAARHVLDQQDGAKEWITRNKAWIEEARRELCHILEDCVTKSIVQEQIESHLDRVQEWCNSGPSTSDQWTSALELVNTLDEYQRVGEGRVLRLWNPKIERMMEGLDCFGIPSALATVGVAKLIHEVLKPRWPQIKDLINEGWIVAWTIVHNRIWRPIKDIFVNLATRQNESLLGFFDVNNEVESLDNMLRDLGFGDGTELTRQHALSLASRRYEKDLEEGLMRNVIRGRLIRLLLIQVQQLKAGMLHALESIDVLVAANRLNAHIVAAIPTVFIVVLGFRFAVRSLYTFRIKAIRSIRDVHAEMADYLDEMEHILVLNKDDRHFEMGEFILHMNSYLVLLDYCSSFFPSRSADAIHKSMQDILSDESSLTNASDVQTAQVETVRLIKEKHTGLLKYL